MTDKIKAQLHQMIADGKTGGVVQQLLEITQYFGDGKLEDQAAKLFREYQTYQHKVVKTSEEEQALELDKINQAALRILDAIPAQGQAPMAANEAASETNQNRSSRWKPVLIVVLIIVLLYLVLS